MPEEVLTQENITQSHPLRILKRVFVEIPIFYLFVTYLEYLIFGSIQAWVIAVDFLFPHPYWLGIVLFALVYGFKEGLIAGLLATAFLIGLSPDRFDWNFLEWRETAILPLFFVLGGMLIGIASSLSKEKLKGLSSTNKKLKHQIKELSGITDQLTRTNLNLEKKIVFRLETFQSIYEIAEQLNKTHLEQLYTTIPQLIRKYFKAEQCSFYLVETDGSLSLKSNFGWSDQELYPTSFPADSELVSALTTYKKVTVLALEKLQSLHMDGCFAVALKTEENSLLGLIKVEQMAFENITQDNIKFLSLLSQWIMQSIVNGLRYAESEKQSTFEPKTGLVREKPFWFLAKKIVASAVRHKHEAVLLILYLNFDPKISSVEKNIIIQTIGDILKDLIRIDDEVGIADMGRAYNFLLMMPFTKKDQTKYIQSKVEKVIIKQISNSYPIVLKPDFLMWEVLSVEDGTLFLSEIVQNNIFDPI